jgi:uncharacterized protein (DUF362 family)
MAPELNGKYVWVKPNMLGPFPPEKGVTTSPELVRAVVRALLDRGAEVVVGDNPGSVTPHLESVADVTGIMKASEGCFRNIGLSTVAVSLGGSWSHVHIKVSSIWLEADYIVNLPCLKTHALHSFAVAT